MRSGRSAPPSSFARRLATLNEELEREWGVRLETRTGINSGQVVAGDPAGGQALVTGDAVNVAARLEQAASAGRDPDRRRRRMPWPRARSRRSRSSR